MSAMASQITSLTIVYSTVYSGVDQRTLQSSASLAFVWGIHRWPVNSPQKRPLTRKMFQFDDVIMIRFMVMVDASVYHFDGCPVYYAYEKSMTECSVSLQWMMTSPNGNNFRVTHPLCGKFTGHRWIPRTKASDAELWCLLRSVRE